MVDHKLLREMQKVYQADWKIFGEDASDIHMGYWYPHDTKLENLVTAQKDYLRELIKPLNIAKDDYILDVGCGNGATAISLAEDYQCRVYAIDIIDIHIESATRAVNDKKLDHRIELRCGDIMDVEFAESTFDHIVSIETLYHLDQRKKCFTLLSKLLKPDGVLAFSEYTLRNSCSWKSSHIAAITTGSNYLALIDDYQAQLRGIYDEVAIEDVTESTMLKTFVWSQREKHAHIRNYAGKAYGWFASIMVPLMIKVMVDSIKKKHWGLNFIRAKNSKKGNHGAQQ